MNLDPRRVLEQEEPRRTEFQSRQVALDLVVVAALPERIDRLLHAVPTLQMGNSYRPGGWSVAQIVHHLVDSHLHSYLRCKYALCETLPHIKPYDENEWVATGECSIEEVRSAQVFLAALHGRWVRLLGSLSPDQWKRSFHHPERNEDFSLFQQVAIYAWHGEHHLAQMALALGTEMPA